MTTYYETITGEYKMQPYIAYGCRYAKLPFRNTIIFCLSSSLSSFMHNSLLSSPVFPGCHLATPVASFLGSTCHSWGTLPQNYLITRVRILAHTLPLGSYPLGHPATWGSILRDTLATRALPFTNAPCHFATGARVIQSTCSGLTPNSQRSTYKEKKVPRGLDQI